jgi:hypothetical protein
MIVVYSTELIVKPELLAAAAEKSTGRRHGAWQAAAACFGSFQSCGRFAALLAKAIL